ncbi:MAG: redoxin domain-containing protein [Prolixibacteraceae bacterium]|nr:redoxin domain-containing protein [Prolixibacteraceae bacterium]
MRLFNLFTFLFFVLFTNSGAQIVHQEPTTLAIGKSAPDFKLKGTDGKFYSLNSFSKANVLVIIFSANHCPTAQAYEDRIISISSEYKSKGVQVVMISSNDNQALNLSELGYTDLGDTYEEMKIRYKDKKFNFPYLYDSDDQKTALAYGPVATPHCFVFDQSRKLKYEGRIDRSEKPGTAQAEDLRNAIDAVIAGNDPEPASTKVFGCSMKWAWKKEYTEQLYKKWANLPVTVNEINVDGIKELVQNKSTKLRLINIWATWCGPCTMEFPDFGIIDRMYRGRDFEFISISIDKPERKEKVLNFLKENEASNKNYIFSGSDVYQLIEAIDPNWKGALPYTLLIEPGGKIVYHRQGTIDPLEMKKTIVDHPLIGRYF